MWFLFAIMVLHTVNSQDIIGCAAICPDLWVPVCCSGNRLFANACDASCAGYSDTECNKGLCNIQCNDQSDCNQIKGLYSCQYDPICIKDYGFINDNKIETNCDKVCVDIDGICSNPDNCDPGYQCIQDGHLKGFCIKYQK